MMGISVNDPLASKPWTARVEKKLFPKSLSASNFDKWISLDWTSMHDSFASFTFIVITFIIWHSFVSVQSLDGWKIFDIWFAVTLTMLLILNNRFIDSQFQQALIFFKADANAFLIQVDLFRARPTLCTRLRNDWTLSSWLFSLK